MLVCGHAKDTERKDVNAKTRNTMMQHDVSFQHNLRKARFVVLHKPKPVGAGAVTNLEEPAHSVKTGAHICQISSESGPHQ
jgi:hypothetical protein